jgi:hypothetical protein
MAGWRARFFPRRKNMVRRGRISAGVVAELKI